MPKEVELYKVICEYPSGTRTEMVNNKALVWIKIDEAIKNGATKAYFEEIV